MHEAVVRPRPENLRIHRRLTDRENDARVLDANVVRREPAADLLPALVVAREIGRDHAPGLAAIGRHVHVLASDVQPVVIVRRQRERRVPDEAVLETIGWPADRRQRPDLHVVHELRAAIVLRDDAAHAPGSRSAGPHEIPVDGIGRREAALATADAHRMSARDARELDACEEEIPCARIARHHGRRPVLPVAVDVIGDSVVDRRVIHLRERQLGLDPRLAAIDRHRDAAVVAHHHAVAVRGIDPDVVVIAAGILRERRIDDRPSAVQRLRPVRREEVRLIGVVGRHAHPVVVVRAARDLPVRVHHLPVVAAVVGAEEASGVGRLAVRRRHAIAGLDERVNTIGIRLADAESHFADRLCRHAGTGEFLPGRTTICRFPNATPRAAARASPCLDLDLPEPGVQNPGIGRVHYDVRRAGGIVHEEHALPALAAVHRAVDAALRLRAVRETERRRVHDLRIRRMHDDARDASRVLESRACPRLSRVGGLEHPPAGRDVAAREGFARARVDDVRIARRNGERADGRHRLRIEDRRPVHAAVRGLEQSTRRGPGVVRVDVARHASDRGHAISFRSDVAVFQPRVDDGIDFLGLGFLELLLRFDLPEDGSSECDESKRDENATHLVHREWGRVGGWGIELTSHPISHQQSVALHSRGRTSIVRR